jgi:hypothetical protein
MRGQGGLEDRQLTMGFETAEALGGFQHGRPCPAQGHRRITPMLYVGTNPADGPVHLLDDVGAGQGTAQFSGHAEAIDGEDFVQPF